MTTPSYSVPSVFFVTHPEVLVESAVPVPEWSLSEMGRQRMQRFADSLVGGGVSSIWASSERKAIEAATQLGERVQLPVRQHPGLGENDRSSTGYLPAARFERMADRFFAEPESSVEGWERALDAQRRIVAAIDDVIAASSQSGHVAVIAHGGVGTLLLCHLRGVPISRAEDQPSQGHWFAFERAERRLLHGWRRFD
jgi:broad specificity phosphatase PhoE